MSSVADPNGRVFVPMQSERALSWAVVGIACLCLLAPALWNGFPLLQYDTGGFLARWFEGYLVPSRPAAYGLLLAPFAALSFWPVLLVQSAATVWILRVSTRMLGVAGHPLAFLALIAALSLLTTLPWLTSILLTDIFAGLAVLALHLLVHTGEQPGALERRGLLGIAAFGAAAHSATLALVAILVGCAAVARLLLPRTVSSAGVRRAFTAFALSITLMLLSNAFVAGRLALTPGGFGILFGRMLQDGIVARYLDDHCPDPKLQLCAFRQELPRDADTFLWGGGLFDRLGRFDKLGNEMRDIVLGSLRSYPLMQLQTAGTAVLKQLVTVASGEGVVNRIWHTYAIIERYASPAAGPMRRARQQHEDFPFEAINRIHVPVALLAAALLPLIVGGALWWEKLAPYGLLAGSVTVSLVANAFVCGALANPHDRYGARLIWLAVLTAFLVLAFLVSRLTVLLAAPPLVGPTCAGQAGGRSAARAPR